MVRLLRSSGSSRSRSSSTGSRDQQRCKEDPPDGRMAKHFKKRFGWCFGPPEPSPVTVERRPLSMQGRRVLSKVTSSSPRVGEPTLEISHTSTEDTSKSEGSSDAGPLLPLGLEALEHSPENFGAVVAECQRLREENRKLQNTLLDFDGQMEALTSECEEILRNTNKRFQAALRSVKYMDTVVQSLREELDNKVRVNTDLELERNLLQRRLGEALNELRLGGGRNHHVAVKSKNEDAGQTRA